jgi:hypothetical protein
MNTPARFLATLLSPLLAFAAPSAYSKPRPSRADIKYAIEHNLTPAEYASYQSARTKKILGIVMLSAGTAIGAVAVGVGAIRKDGGRLNRTTCNRIDEDEAAQCRSKRRIANRDGDAIIAVGATIFAVSLGGGLYLTFTSRRDIQETHEKALEGEPRTQTKSFGLQFTTSLN